MEHHNRDLHQMLREFSRALAGAISDSPALERSLERIRSGGYSLQLTVNSSRLASTSGSAGVAAPGPDGSSEPSFRIDAQDLSFLRSIGIDPTRRLRRRKS